MDALAAGVKTIITSQGFHLDLKHGITHPFREYKELKEIFQKISADRRARVDSVASLTWENYAKRHLIVWQALLDGKRSELPYLLQQSISQAEVDLPTESGSAGRLRRMSGWTKVANPARFNLLLVYHLPRARARLRRALRRFVPR